MCAHNGRVDEPFAGVCNYYAPSESLCASQSCVKAQCFNGAFDLSRPRRVGTVFKGDRSLGALLRTNTRSRAHDHPPEHGRRTQTFTSRTRTLTRTCRNAKAAKPCTADFRSSAAAKALWRTASYVLQMNTRHRGQSRTRGQGATTCGYAHPRACVPSVRAYDRTRAHVCTYAPDSRRYNDITYDYGLVVSS